MKKISLLFLSILSGMGLCQAQSYTPVSLPSGLAAKFFCLRLGMGDSQLDSENHRKLGGKRYNIGTGGLFRTVESRPADRQEWRPLYITGL